jgi:two-component system, cell cycle response regulator
MPSNLVDFKNRRVLIVDDDEHTRVLLCELCTASGYQVSDASNGTEALQSLKNGLPDLLLLDINMPDFDGFSLLRQIREKEAWTELPVILLTANGDMDVKIRGMELGADDYITKPFRLVDLQTRITSALTVREYRRRLEAAEEELAQFRAVDPVTGAGTYSQLKASLDAEVARSRRYGRALSVVMFGFDDYQKLRYHLGREACDTYLGVLTREIKSCLRGADRLFRVDADEFIVLLPETDAEGARILAERLLHAANQLLASGALEESVRTLRFGAALFPTPGIHSAEDLLREANRSYRQLKTARALMFSLDQLGTLQSAASESH